MPLKALLSSLQLIVLQVRHQWKCFTTLISVIFVHRRDFLLKCRLEDFRVILNTSFDWCVCSYHAHVPLCVHGKQQRNVWLLFNSDNLGSTVHLHLACRRGNGQCIGFVYLFFQELFLLMLRWCNTLSICCSYDILDHLYNSSTEQCLCSYFHNKGEMRFCWSLRCHFQRMKVLYVKVTACFFSIFVN